MQTEKITRNPLKMNQVIKLSGWLTHRKDHADFKKLSQEGILHLAVKDLGFNITPANLRKVAKESNIELPRIRTERPNMMLSKNITRSQISMIRKGLIELYSRLGETVPDYLNFDRYENTN
jgi:aspartyl-tRNA synthetase